MGLKLLFASSIDPDTITALRERYEVVCAFNAPAKVLQEKIVDCEVVIFRSGVQISAEVMACAPRLRLLIRAGSGVDNVDLQYLQQKQLRFVRIPGPGAQAVAEMAFAFMLALSRRLFEADRLWRSGRWAKAELAGYNLAGKTLGIVGCGNIGSRVGQLGVAWGMRVLGCVENASPKVAAHLAKHNIALEDFEKILPQADFLSLHVPLQASTRHLINAGTLAQMKSGAFLINLARGGVVHEADLFHALQIGKLRGAALDVHEQEGEGKISPFAEMPNVILSPHIGAMTVDAQREIGRLVTQTLSRFEAEDAVFASAAPLVL